MPNSRPALVLVLLFACSDGSGPTALDADASPLVDASPSDAAPALDSRADTQRDASPSDGATSPDAATGDVLTNVAAVVTGPKTDCAIVDGRVLCWGFVLGSQPSVFGAHSISELSEVTSLAIGSAHACAVRTGDLWCWGYGGAALYPDGLGPQRAETPRHVFAGAKSVVTGDGFTCALAPSGGVTCWGSVTADFADALQLVASGNRVCAVLATGRISCWGPSTSPTALEAPRKVSQLAVSTSHSCAVTATGVFCWGDNAFGQLGLDPEEVSVLVEPGDALTAPSTAKELAVGDTFSCGLFASQVFCWGEHYGFTPVAVALAKPKQLSARGDHVCAVLEDSSLACWRAGETPALVHNAK